MSILQVCRGETCGDELGIAIQHQDQISFS
jgi:hypothetical protein